jgi:hypothetical protein
MAIALLPILVLGAIQTQADFREQAAASCRSELRPPAGLADRAAGRL